MLNPIWYLPGGDWFAQLPDAPRPSDYAQSVIDHLAELFHGESSFDPAKTAATTHVLLLAVEHLDHIMTSATGRHDLTELARLLYGLNLAQTHLTRTIQRIAGQVNGRTFNGLTNAPTAVVQTLTDTLSTAGANSEICAGHLKKAHLILQTSTT